LPDGCVELIAEGIKVDIDDLLEQVRSGMGPAITRERQESHTATGEFKGFSIRM
jgi:acylphosphatase